MLWLKALQRPDTRIWTVMIGVGGQILGQGSSDEDGDLPYKPLFALRTTVGLGRIMGDTK